MSSQILKIIAALMLTGSLILIGIAYRMGKSPQSQIAPLAEKIVTPPEATVEIVKVTHPIGPDQVLMESDLTLESVSIRPTGSFSNKTELLGRRTLFDIPQGSPVLRSHLTSDNRLTHALKPEERAIAIKVDEIIGVGGFVQPGDFVDVVAFVRENNQDIEEPQAVVAIHSVRILAYGEEIPIPNDSAITSTGNGIAPKKEKSKDGEEGDSIKGKSGRSTAILAINNEQTSLVSLLENASVLRLALRPLNVPNSDNKPYSVTISDVIEPGKKKSPDNKPNSFQPDKPVGPMVEIYHGTHVEQIQYP